MKHLVLTIDQLRPGLPANALTCYLKALENIQLSCAYLTPTASVTENPLTGYELRRDVEAYFERRGISSQHIEASTDTELVVLSRNADVIVLDASISFDRKTITGPSRTLKHILRNTNCPVFIAPQTFEGITSLIYCHDGTAAGFYALKQLSYLFPLLNKLQLTVFTLGDRPGLQEMNLLREWLHVHYPLATVKSAGGRDKSLFFETLRDSDDVLLIFGAYNRSLFSQWFKRSHADFFIQFFNATIFIAHP